MMWAISVRLVTISIFIGAVVVGCAPEKPRSMDSVSPADTESQTLDTAVDTDGGDGYPVYTCPPPPEDAVEFGWGTSELTIYFIGKWAGPAGLFVNMSGVNYVYPNGCTADGWYEASSDGSIPDAMYTSDQLSLPREDNPFDYQGIYTVVPDTDMWGAEPAQDVSIGWYDAASGSYQHVISNSSFSEVPDTTQICISRIRPDRLSGTIQYAVSADDPTHADDGPFYITFDMIKNTTSTHPEDCVAVFYQDTNYDKVWGAVLE